MKEEGKDPKLTAKQFKDILLKLLKRWGALNEEEEKKVLKYIGSFNTYRLSHHKQTPPENTRMPKDSAIFVKPRHYDSHEPVLIEILIEEALDEE